MVTVQPHLKGMEEAVIITIPLGESGFDLDEKFCRELESCLSRALEASGSGEYDGNEFGEGIYKVFLYGPSADSIFMAVMPLLLHLPVPSGSYVIKRYGPPGSRSEMIKVSPPDPLIPG